jgi:curved DNA-binding protein CbpA
LKDYYQLLELTPAASQDEIKRAFRAQIARYHPDKVQHLGHEFQEMAASRATALTEAYHILSDAGRRAEYDTSRTSRAPSAPSARPPTSPPVDFQPRASAASAAHDPTIPSPAHGEESQRTRTGRQFVEERASRDEFVRTATISRFRQMFALVAGGGYDESPVRGFDLSWAPKAKLFARAKGARILGRFVRRVDSASVADAWSDARKLIVNPDDQICVMLMGTDLAPQRELADAIAEQRRRPSRGGTVTLIPVDSSVWDAHLPTDAPAVAKELLVRLRRGA